MRKVLSVDVMHALKRGVLRLREVGESDRTVVLTAKMALMSKDRDARAVESAREGGAHVGAENCGVSLASAGAGSEGSGAEAA